MKLKLLPALLATAYVGFATTASAGVIQASYKNYASEVFGSDTIVLTAPTINYALALPLSGTVANPNSFSITWTLTSGGVFTAAPAATSISLSDPSGGNLVRPTSVTISADGKAITAVFTVTLNYTTQSQIVLGDGGPVTITQVGTILGAPATNNSCGNDVANVNVAVKLTNSAGAEFDSNFALAPLQNTTPILQSQVALSVLAASSSTFTPLKETSRVNVLIPSLGLAFTSDADVTPVTTLINIGSVTVKDRAAPLFDRNGSFPYSTAIVGFGTNPNTAVGIVEANSLRIEAAGNFLTTAKGGAVFPSLAPDCSTTLEAQTANIAVDGKSATLTVSTANIPSLFPGVGKSLKPVYMCYSTTGANVIPTGQFSVTGGSLGKFATSQEIQNSVCPGNVYNLVANGVRIDVRNYLPQVVRAASGWYSVIRIINTDEQQTVTPVIQALLADGTLGALTGIDAVNSVDGKNGPFKPREVRYYTSTALDAALTAVASATRPTYGAADVGGNARLRITAPSSSLRVQNYNFNATNGNFFEASAAQGDDGPDYDRKADADNK
jgi:hypothetical protein